jgi:hypothetical protein
MKFIEMTGKTLFTIIENDGFTEDDLRAAGVEEDTIVRVNQQGDLEVRRDQGWDIIGGLLGNFEQRIRRRTGLDWC